MKLLVTLAVSALLLGACAGDGDTGPSTTRTTDTRTTDTRTTDSAAGRTEPAATSATDTAVTGNVIVSAEASAPELPTTGATLSVTLQDVSVADAPAMVLSSQTIELIDQEFPIPFELPYDLGDIVENHTYSVAARVEAGGDLLMISDTMTPVITNGAPTSAVEVGLVSIAAN